MNDIFNLSGKTAIVTGASSGLGKHFAKPFLTQEQILLFVPGE